MEQESSSHPYERLTPDVILSALEDRGWHCDGRLLALNSYENRVYQVGIEGETPVIAKFYRPGRWTRAAILEEHAYSRELLEHEIPVVAPLADSKAHTLSEAEGFLFAVYPRRGGRWPDLDTREQRLQMGRFLGRMHAVGATRDFEHRNTLSIESLGEKTRDFVLEHNLIPDYLVEAYASLTADLLTRIRQLFEAVGPLRKIRLHGDCHKGNILWNEQGPNFVDLDDSCNGPPVQDIWMLLSGEAEDMRVQLDDLLEGYQTFFEFEYSSIVLIEALRTLRIMHYAAWIARRWDDPAFPLAFPWFDSPRYWEEHILALREQAAALDNPPLL
ncbi:MAG TPA: serine/threonine protein kinase [Gammaproteobacteria bacterium]|nr:serine/threonine protein kinase [Gammaproteobacteria bacterium]